MFSAIRIHWLGLGELPLYRGITSPTFYIFEMNRQDPSSSLWFQHATLGGHRLLLPLEIDTEYRVFETLLPGWLRNVDDVCPNGTLIFALRTAAEIEPGFRFVLAGLGCVPEGTIAGAVDLQGAQPEQLILQVCREPHGENINELHPALRGMYADLIASREQHSRWVEEQAQAETKAKQLLLRFLTMPQKEEFEQTGAFHVWGQDGRLYRIRDRCAHNVDLIEEGRPVMRYCIISKEAVPRYDELLAQKLLLESRVEDFLRLANFTPLENSPNLV